LICQGENGNLVDYFSDVFMQVQSVEGMGICLRSAIKFQGEERHQIGFVVESGRFKRSGVDFKREFSCWLEMIKMLRNNDHKRVKKHRTLLK
jgi:hypothetical protein